MAMEKDGKTDAVGVATGARNRTVASGVATERHNRTHAVGAEMETGDRTVGTGAMPKAVMATGAVGGTAAARAKPRTGAVGAMAVTDPGARRPRANAGISEATGIDAAHHRRSSAGATIAAPNGVGTGTAAGCGEISIFPGAGPIATVPTITGCGGDAMAGSGGAATDAASDCCSALRFGRPIP